MSLWSIHVNLYRSIQLSSSHSELPCVNKALRSDCFMDCPQVINHGWEIPELNGGFSGKIIEPQAMIDWAVLLIRICFDKVIRFRFFWGGFLLFCCSCFSAFLLFLLFRFLRFLLLCFSASLLFLLLSFLLLCFSAFCFSCFSAFMLLCLSTSTFYFFCSHVFLLLYFFLLLCFSASLLPFFYTVSLLFLFFYFLSSPVCILNETQGKP